MIPKTILVPIDFSSCSERALDYACALSEKLGSTIHLMNAVGVAVPEFTIGFTGDMVGSLQAAAMTKLDALGKDREAIAKFGKSVVEPGDARDDILKVAETLVPDLIVMGTHGRRGITRLVLGSVTEHILRRAPCPVLIVRCDK